MEAFFFHSRALLFFSFQVLNRAALPAMLSDPGAFPWPAKTPLEVLFGKDSDAAAATEAAPAEEEPSLEEGPEEGGSALVLMPPGEAAPATRTTGPEW